MTKLKLLVNILAFWAVQFLVFVILRVELDRWNIWILSVLVYHLFVGWVWLGIPREEKL